MNEARATTGGTVYTPVLGREHADRFPAAALPPRRRIQVVRPATRRRGSANDPADAIGLKVFPPGQRTATVISFSFRACAKKGPVFLTVRTTVAGTGIPGFST